MKCFEMKPGERASFAYRMYYAREYKEAGNPCASCELPEKLCKGSFGQGNFCHPEQRTDGKQIVFKEGAPVKKRNRTQIPNV